MRTSAFAVIIFVFAIGVASAATPGLWAIGAGYQWPNPESFRIYTDPYSVSKVTYPIDEDRIYDELRTVVDAAYLPATDTLYLSGWGPNNTQWYEQNTIAIYSGQPGDMTFVSLSNEGMAGYNWLNGIEYLDGSIYAIGYTDLEGDNFLIRIDDPGTASQTVTQVGDYLGATETMGTPYGMYRDDEGWLIGSFANSQDTTNLYRMDPATGTVTLLHSYITSAELGGGALDGLVYRDGTLYGQTHFGVLYEIDTENYGLTELGTLPGDTDTIWTCLVAVPEPSSFILLGSGISVLLVFRKRR